MRDWEVWTPKLDTWTLVCSCGATFVLPRGVLTECPRCRTLVKTFIDTGGRPPLT